MLIKIFQKFLLCLALFTSPLSGQVIINEIAWMGTNASTTDEWIELYNNSASTIDLSGWRLTAFDGTPSIDLTGIIGVHDFFLLERTSDNTISDIIANMIYTGVLGNKGEHLQLFNDKTIIVDEINCSSGWFAGDNSLKLSMERINPLLSGSKSENWGNNNQLLTAGHDSKDSLIMGTPLESNSIKDISLPVLIDSFRASAEKIIILNWNCQNNDMVHGFYLFRSEQNQNYKKITAGLIQSQPDKTSYRFNDSNIKKGVRYSYKLEVIDIEKNSSFYGPVTARISADPIQDHSALLKVYPNPFNPQTTVSFTLGKDSHLRNTSLRIVNCLGQSVKTLTESIKNPGEHTIIWDGKDNYGQQVANGIYFLQLLSDNRLISTHRMIKLK